MSSKEGSYEPNDSQLEYERVDVFSVFDAILAEICEIKVLAQNLEERASASLKNGVASDALPFQDIDLIYQLLCGMEIYLAGLKGTFKDDYTCAPLGAVKHLSVSDQIERLGRGKKNKSSTKNGAIEVWGVDDSIAKIG